MQTMHRLVIALSLLLLAPLPTLAFAADSPTGKTILTLRGQIDHTNDDGSYVFDMSMLEQLPQHSFTTNTPWYPEAHTFTGPLLRDVLDKVGAKGTLLRAIALNDYKVEIPIGDPRKFDVIIARLLDGKPMPVRKKGPLFIIYPFDQVPETQSQIYYNRSIWQLKAIEIE